MTSAERPLVHLGWLGVHSDHDDVLERSYRAGAQLLADCLEQQFPMFNFQVEVLTRGRYAGQGVIDPVDLLEIGLHEKTCHQWDYALVLTPNELRAREKAFTLGGPSSALETAVMSTLWFREQAIKPEKLAAVALYFLGHMWGLSIHQDGMMAPRATPEEWSLLSFSPKEQSIIIDRLEEVADARLEDKVQARSRIVFIWQAFWADPKSILTDIVGYRPWKQPFRLRGLTAAAFVTMLLLFLAAESWELSIHADPAVLLSGVVLSIAGATIYLYRGQNLGRLSRAEGLVEQLERSRLILFCCLCIGMTTLWLILFFSAVLISMALPREVIERWLGMPVRISDLCRFASFAAIMGVAAAALGGNLEDEDVVKARFFFDEET